MISTGCCGIIEALSCVGPDRSRPDIYDRASPHVHILDALRHWAVNRRTSSNWTPPKPGRTIVGASST